MALLLLLHNAHFLLGVACQGKNPVTFSHSLTFLPHLCFIAYICFIFHRMCSLPSSSRRLPRSEYSFSRCGGQGAAPPRLLQHRYSCHNHSEAKAPKFKLILIIFFKTLAFLFKAGLSKTWRVELAFLRVNKVTSQYHLLH